MGTDLSLVAGLLLLLLAAPSLLSALIGARARGLPLALVLIGALLVGYAEMASPAGYRAQDIPEAVLRVIAWITG